MSEFEQYRALFVAESRENHENLVRNLLVLEKGSDQNAINEIFRSIHTLKGASASMGFSNMERLCHKMEDVFQLIRNGSAAMSRDLGTILFTCTDILEAMLDEIGNGGDSSSRNPEEQVQALQRWLEQRGAAGPVPAPALPDTSSATGDAAPGATGPHYMIRITVAPECTMKDVRAILALQNLEALGTVLSVAPSRDAIDEGKFNGTVEILIASEAGRDALCTAASGTEIAGVEIAPAGQDGTDANAAPAAPGAAVSPAATAASGTGAGRKAVAATEKAREVKNLRVDIAQLDHIMNLVEDLVINRGRLKLIAEQHKIKEMDEAISMVERSVSDLQNLMMAIRMIPLSHIFNRLPRVVRDVALHDNKEVEFTIEGAETELDRSVMDGLNDPLLHLIRNAVNHGIETPDVRERAGKPRKGTVKLAAHRDRDNVIIELTDDGAGIDLTRVRNKAIEKGLVTPEAAASLSEDEAIELLFQPGFSTAETITDISGRGVGLDVVRRSIEALKGTIKVESVPGKGSRFELLLPPTMAIVDVLIVKVNKKRLAIPISSVVEVANFQHDAIHRIGNAEAMVLREEVLQIFWLDEMVGRSDGIEILIVAQYQKHKCGIPVDAVEGKQEVVVKPLSRFIGSARGITGLTILGDGEVVPVLDVNTIR